ncbi:MAG: TRAP transporter small permease [Pseudomonadota bacterium]
MQEPLRPTDTVEVQKKDAQPAKNHAEHAVFSCAPQQKRCLLATLSVFLNAFSHHTNRIASYWLIAALGLMAILIGVQVFCRYIMNNSLFWSEEVGRIVLVQITFLGASIAFKSGVHPSIRTLVDRFHPQYQRYIQLFTLIISCGFFAVLAWYGANFALFISQQVTPSLGISKAIPVAVIPIASAVACIHALAQITTLLQKKPLLNQDNTHVTNIVTHKNNAPTHPQDGGQS